MSPGDARKDRVDLLYLFDVLRSEELVLVSDIPFRNMLPIVLACQSSLGQRAVGENCDVVLPAVRQDLFFDLSL